MLPHQDFARAMAENTLAVFQDELTSTFNRWKTQFSESLMSQFRQQMMERLHTPTSYTENFGEIKYDVTTDTPLVDSKEFHYCRSYHGNIWQGTESDGKIAYRIRNLDYDKPNRPVFDISGRGPNPSDPRPTHGDPPFPVVAWAPPSADEHIISMWEYSGITIMTNHFNIYYFPRVENITQNSPYVHKCPHILHTSDKPFPDDMIDFMKHYCDEAADRDRDGSFTTYFHVRCELIKQTPVSWLRALGALHKFILEHVGKHWSRRTYDPLNNSEDHVKLEAARAALERERASIVSLKAFYDVMRSKITNTQEKLKSLSTEAKKSNVV